MIRWHRWPSPRAVLQSSRPLAGMHNSSTQHNIMSPPRLLNDWWFYSNSKGREPIIMTRNERCRCPTPRRSKIGAMTVIVLLLMQPCILLVNSEAIPHVNDSRSINRRSLQATATGLVACRGCAEASCLAVGTIGDAHCAQCAKGQTWWPCDQVDTCYCKLPASMAPTIAPSIAPFELITINFDVVGLPIDVTSEQMSNEGLVAVNRITLLLGDVIDGLEVMEVKVRGEEDSNATNTADASTVRRRRRRRRRRLKDETMSYDVYVAKDESGILFGPIIAETMKDNHNEIWKAIREHPEIEYLDYPNVQVTISSGGESIYNLDVTTPYPSMAAVVPSPSVAYNSSATTTTVSAPSAKEGLAGWAISFIVIIVVTVLCCIAFGGMYYLEKKDSEKAELDGNGDRSRSSGKKMSFFDLDDRSQARSHVSSHMSSKKQKKEKRISSGQRKIGSQGSVASNDRLAINNNYDDASSAKESFDGDSRSLNLSSRNHRIPRDPTMYLDYIAEDQAYIDEGHDFQLEQQQHEMSGKSLSSQRNYTSQESRNSRIKEEKQSTRMSSSIFSQESDTSDISSRHADNMGSARNSTDVSVTSSRSNSSFNSLFL